jgi:predicted glycoside hydrolase/deacetylase ChbG (UPF0249 family)
MDGISVFDTIAYRVMDEYVSHAYEDEEIDEDGFMNIYNVFRKRGGSWEAVINGDPGHINAMKETVDSYFEVRDAAEKYGLVES